jgi:uncharacterized repeat protein (TIGR03943 family)
MVAPVRREVQNLLLVLVGGVLLRLSISGAYTSYVKPGLGPYLTTAGATLAVLGLWSLLRDARHTVTDGHRHRGSRAAWLLLLPTFTIFLIAPPPLGAYAADRGSVSVPQPSAENLPPIQGDPADLDVVGFVVRAVWDSKETLKGHRVRMTGFVTEDPAGGWYLTRMEISCCAADAQPFKIQALGAPPFPANTWVQIVGGWIPGGGRRRDAIPIVKVDTAVQVAQPADPYN